MSDTPQVRPERPAEPLPEGMVARPGAVEIVRFLCELFAVGSLALWGFLSWPFPWNVVAGLGAPALAIAVWALFVSPKPVLVTHPFGRAIAELAVWAAATAAWWDLGQPWIGLAFAVVAVSSGLVVGRRRLS